MDHMIIFLKKSHVIPSLIRKMLTKEKRVEVYGGPSISRDFIYVDDLLVAIFKFLKFKDKKPLNFSNGKATSLLELLKSIKKVTGTYNKKIFIIKKNLVKIYYYTENYVINAQTQY